MEKHQLKKKLNEATIEGSALNEKMVKVSKTCETLESRIRELEGELQKKGVEKGQQTIKWNQLKKSYDDLKIQEDLKVK